MNAVEVLLTDLRARGVRFELTDARVQVVAPKGLLTAADRAALSAHRDDIREYLTSMADGQRFLGIDPSRLPPAPFMLTPWQQVVDAERFYAALRDDLRAGPGGVRFTAALADIGHLMPRLVEQQ